ncbi:MAG TPA: carboxypeptidase-like regulatory domain-containing protein [Bryobacteraceae bacterium]
MTLRPGFAGKKFATAVASLGILASAASVRGADLSLPVTGELLGKVVDSTGVPQLGAAVQLFNKYQRAISHTSTDAQGHFAFVGLPADSYTVRVSLASFLPVSRDQVMVKPGVDSVLEIHLATLLSSIEVTYHVPTGAMSEEWKWALRASPGTRLVTRLLPDDFPAAQPKLKPHVFSGTHAMLAVSGGDGGLLDPGEIATDLGTSFALSTNIFGKNQVQVAGTLGQNADFGPSAVALAAIYSRTDDMAFVAAPEITFQLAQLGGLGGQLNSGSPSAMNLNGSGIPVLRTMSLGIYQTTEPLGMLHVEYGATGETVEYAQHINRISPFARVTADMGLAGSVAAVYSDGRRPYELISHQKDSQTGLDMRTDDLSAPLDSLSHLPQISEHAGQLELQRTQNYELGYQKVSGSRTYAASGFYERVWNGRLNVAGDLSGLDPGDVFSDGFSMLSSYNIGRYNRTGYLASVDQRLNDSLDMAIAYGRLGGFTANPDGSFSSGRFLEEKSHNLASVSGRGRVPGIGTRISANYGWVDAEAAIPRHFFTTQNAVALPGFNVLVRQPLPSPFGMPCRLELTADLRNLLAQGYVPVGTADGRHLLVVESPRAIRGGLKFTF